MPNTGVKLDTWDS